MTRKAIGPKIDPAAAEELAQLGDTINHAATVALEAWPTLYQRALVEIRGRFSGRELRAILDVSNGVYLVPAHLGQHLELSVADGCELEDLHVKWEIEPDTLLKRIRTLTSFQRAALELWAQMLWRNARKRGLWEREIERLASD